jgi:lysophospholipase L1-like esterase
MASKKIVPKNIISYVKFFCIFILCVISIAAAAVAWFTYKQPQEVISVLETLVPSITPVPVHMNGITVLGDSQSDEYRADDNRGSNYPATTMNWVELLAQKRNVNFGTWGKWDDPRRTGYEYNWARTGATSRSMIESGQHTGAAEQIKDGKVNVVVVFIGANDFSPYITQDGYEAIYNGRVSDAQKLSKMNRILADLKTAITVLKQAGPVKILLVKIPDWGIHPGVNAAFPIPDQKAQVTNFINQTNDEIDKLAKEEDLETFDINQFYADLLYRSNDNKLTVDAVPLETLLLNNDPKNIYLDDGVHLGTAVNGFLANAILAKLNLMITNPVKPFTQKEIREAAGL